MNETRTWENLVPYEIGKRYLVNTTDWFFAPDGESYKAAFGTLRGIYSSEETLGVRTNAKSTNWYVQIGGMTIAGCQIHYVIRADDVMFDPPTSEIEHEGKKVLSKCGVSRIYNADNQ